MKTIACIADLQRIAKQRVPKMFYQYCDSGSWSESTYRANEQDFSEILFRQRTAVDIAERSIATQMIGEPVSMPVALAPVGLLGMQHADGEIHAARAAKAFGIPFTLSTMSICSIETVAKAVDYHPFWFQLYVMNDKRFLHNIIDRAKDANCGALVITLDLQILAQRHHDVRNGLSAPPKPTVSNILNLLTKPRWCYQMAQTKNHHFGNIMGHVEGVSDISRLNEWTTQQFDLRLNWQSVEEIIRLWDGKVILKGIMDAEDAKRAAQVGADAIVVSNHGGRQLDGTESSIKALPKILAAVGDKVEVHLDGGIRSGQDVLRAVALGAKGTYIGRAFVYGLGAYGEAGVRKALEILHTELDVTMALCGKKNIGDVDREIFLPPFNKRSIKAGVG